MSVFVPDLLHIFGRSDLSPFQSIPFYISCDRRKLCSAMVNNHWKAIPDTGCWSLRPSFVTGWARIIGLVLQSRDCESPFHSLCVAGFIFQLVCANNVSAECCVNIIHIVRSCGLTRAAVRRGGEKRPLPFFSFR